MKLETMARQLNLLNLTPTVPLNHGVEVYGAHACELLSDVLANAPPGAVLITIQTHMNVLAVAARKNISAIVFASGQMPTDEVIQKAVEKGIPLFSSKDSTFDVAGQLYAFGLRETGGDEGYLLTRPSPVWGRQSGLS